MDAVTEFLKAVGDRFRNPFLFSFTIALVLANWEVPIAMFWNDQTGTQTLREFIRSNPISIGGPLVFAIGFCLVIPLIGQILNNYYTLVNTAGNERALKTARKSMVSGELHFTKMNELETLKGQYAKAMTDYDTVLKERDA